MKRINIICLLIFLIGLLIRLYKINLPLLEFEPTRQIQTAEITRNLFSDGFKILQPTVRYLGPGKIPFLIEFPGLNAAVAFLYLLNGSVNETLGRLFSVFGWAVSFLLLYLVSKEIIGEKFSVATVLFYSLSPMSIFVSRSFQPDQWMVTFSLAAIYFALIWNKSGRLTFFLISALLASISVLTKIPSFLFTVVPIMALILYQKREHKLIHLISYAGPVLALSALWYFYAAVITSTNHLTRTLENFSIHNWFRPELFLTYRYYSSMFGYEDLLVIMPIGFILLALGLGVKLKTKQYFLYFWLFGLALYFLVFNRHSMVHEYYHFPFLPLASIFMALGFMYIVRIFKNNPLAYCFIIGVFVLSAVPQFFYKAYQPIGRFNYVVETGKEVQKITKPNDLVIGSMDNGPTLVYYSKRNGWGFDIEGKSNPQVDGKSLGPQEYLEYLRSKGAVVFAGADKKRFLDNYSFANYMYSKYKILANNDNFVIFDLVSHN